MCTEAKTESTEVTHQTIATRLNLARTTVTRILNNDPSYRASQRTREKVMTLAQQLGYDFSNLRRIHRRRHERRLTNIEARLRFVLEDGHIFDEGLCTILNISLVGALLGNLRLPKSVLPLTYLTIHLEAQSGPLAGVSIAATLARFACNRHPEIGVSFVPSDATGLAKLKEALDNFQAQTPQGNPQ